MAQQRREPECDQHDRDNLDGRVEAEPDYRDQPGQQPGGHGDDAFNHVVGQVNCASRRPGDEPFGLLGRQIGRWRVHCVPFASAP